MEKGPQAMSGTYLFDYSQINFPEDRIWVRVSDTEMICKICLFVPVIIFGLLGNYMIIRLIVVNRSLRTPTNFIIVNMAVADFLTLLICPGMFMVNDFHQNYVLGCVGCKLEGFLVVTFLITAVLNLSVVSYDRLMAIVMPTKTRLSMHGAQFVIAMTWIAGFLLAMPLTIYRDYRVRQWKNFKESYCKEDVDILPKYWYVLITVLVWFPLGSMLICYSAIFYKLDRYEKSVLKREHPLKVNYKKSVARTLFIVVIVFIVLRLPFTIMVIMRDKTYTTQAMVDSSFMILWFLSQYLMFLNAAINPLIYGYTNENFRRAYQQTPLFYCCKANKQEDESRATIQKEDPTAKQPKQDGFGRLFCCSCCEISTDDGIGTTDTVNPQSYKPIESLRVAKNDTNQVQVKEKENDKDVQDNGDDGENEGYI